MVPTDYRLETVTARLLERLEGARRSYAHREDDARSAFEETADAHLTAAIAEFADVAMEDPATHGAFLRREIRSTALPRYHHLAMRMNRAEQGGYGFGWLAAPTGRMVLVIGAMILTLGLLRLAGSPVVWPMILVVMSSPTWPSIGAWLVQRRYQQDVQEIVDDMARIQQAARAYLAEDQLKASRDEEADRRPSDPARTRTRDRERP